MGHPFPVRAAALRNLKVGGWELRSKSHLAAAGLNPGETHAANVTQCD